MNKIKLFKIISLLLIVTMMLPNASVVSAKDKNTQKIKAKTVFVKEVNEYGTNLNNESIDGKKYKTLNTKLEVTTSSDNTITITTKVGKDKVVITGKPIARSENSKVVFYSGECSNSNYSIMNFSYEKDIVNSNIYFINSRNKSSNDSVLKIYLKENNSKTRDFILMESFEYNPKLSDEFISALDADNSLESWGCGVFSPITIDEGEEEPAISVFSLTDTKYFYCTKTYKYMNEYQTHTIKYKTTAEYLNVPVTQDALQDYRLTVYDKSCIHSVFTEFNSYNSSMLFITGLSLDQTSIPGTAWKYTQISGKVNKSGNIVEAFGASIGVSLGVLSIGLDIPTLFNSSGSVYVGDTYRSYENGPGGKYTRSINTKLNSNYDLVKEGQYFEVSSLLRDYRNIKASAQLLKARWHIEITELQNQKIYNYYADHNVYVAIK